MNALDLAVRRPVSVAMVFLAISLLGVVAWQRIPVELFPAIQGDNLYVSFQRAGAEPEVVEREVLMALDARVAALPMVAESGGSVRGSGGNYWVRFEPGTDLKVRELEMRRIAAAIEREQPRGTGWVRVMSAESRTAAMGSFVMVVFLLGEDVDRQALHDFAEQELAPRFAATPGVSEAVATGGSHPQLRVLLDPQRLAAAGVTAEEATAAVSRNVQHMRYAGAVESENGRLDVLVDGRPTGANALREARVVPGRAAKLGDVADVFFGYAPDESIFRVNGEPAVGIAIYQEQGANLIELGRALRERVAELQTEVQSSGLELRVGIDAAAEVGRELGRLAWLGFTGYLIAMLVLFLFLRDWRAVAVVGVAVPVSLLGAVALLYLFDQTLNIISLVGLSLSIGLLIDNSIVVFESVLRRAERGLAPNDAVREGLRRTGRAIAAASLTTAIVFLPTMLVDIGTFARSMVEILALAILLPLAASLLVAVGLVPVLAHRLAVPAVRRRVARQRAARSAAAGRQPPDALRILFTGLLASALRRPAAMLSATLFAVLITAATALPIAIASSVGPEADQADEVEIAARFGTGRSPVGALAEAVAQVEAALMAIEGVETVLADIAEEGATITVQFVAAEERPPTLTVSRVREVADGVAERIERFEVLRPGEDQQQGSRPDPGGGFDAPPRQIVISGPETAPMQRLARDLVARLETVPEVDRAWQWTQPGVDELWIEPRRSALDAFGLNADAVLPMLSIAGREGYRAGQGFVLPSGREIPVVVERVGVRDEAAVDDLRRLRLHTDAGVVPANALATLRQMPPPPTIVHHNGRREASVYFRLDRDIEGVAAERVLDGEVAAVVQTVPRPAGYTVELSEESDTASTFSKLALPAVALLLLVLAMAFESLTLPLLVLLALPLTLLGATWLLVVTDTPAGYMAAAGALMLFGLTVNPAILLVDRMQQRIRAGWSGGAAALASVRERTRPVLMTSATTMAALWPLALASGRENEIWPPFAVVVIGGLATSTLLTLLVVPVAFVLLRRLDALFGRVGPWLVVAWLAATAAVVAPLTLADIVTSLFWQTGTAILAGAVMLAVIVLLFRQQSLPSPATAAGPPALEVRNLRKVYGRPGPLRQAVRAKRDFVADVAARGGSVAGVVEAGDGAPWVFSRRALEQAVARFGPTLVLAVAPFLIAMQVSTAFWKLALWLVGAAFGARLLGEIRRARGHANAAGEIEPGGPEGVLRVLLPWLVLAVFSVTLALDPAWRDAPPAVLAFWPVVGGLILALGQLTRHSAVRQQRGLLPPRPQVGPLRYPRTLLRRWMRRLGGLDLPVRPVLALAAVSFRIDRGMVGVLGPNGAGKTTLLRQLAGILDPTRGAIRLGDVPLGLVQKVLARWVGYLPQDAGMPAGLSGREYLSYFAGLYELPPQIRAERVSSLLREVGLGEKADDKIGSLSGGQRQRVAVARTLLRLPPVIIVDEPTVGLDPRERIRFRNLLARLAEDRIVLFSTHVVEDVAVACERVLVLARGRLAFDGPPPALAKVAEGRVWEVRDAGAEYELPPAAVLAEETPTADGTTVRRVLADAQPAETAKRLPARLEDGYLWLIAQP